MRAPYEDPAAPRAEWACTYYIYVVVKTNKKYIFWCFEFCLRDMRPNYLFDFLYYNIIIFNSCILHIHNNFTFSVYPARTYTTVPHTACATQKLSYAQRRMSEYIVVKVNKKRIFWYCYHLGNKIVLYRVSARTGYTLQLGYWSYILSKYTLHLLVFEFCLRDIQYKTFHIFFHLTNLQEPLRLLQNFFMTIFVLDVFFPICCTSMFHVIWD